MWSLTTPFRGERDDEPPRAPEEVHIEPSLEDLDLRQIIASAEIGDGELAFMGQTRRLSEEGYARVKAAIDMLDLTAEEAAGQWTSKRLTWDAVQRSAASTLLMPSTIYQGETTTCGATRPGSHQTPNATCTPSPSPRANAAYSWAVARHLKWPARQRIRQRRDRTRAEVNFCLNLWMV